MKECNDCAIRSKAVNTLSKDEFKFHCENCAELVLEAGETIFKEGQLSSHIAYLKSGLAKINKKGITGNNQILKIVQPSRYIGLQAILANKVHQYSASVIEKSRVCYVDARSFRELIKRNANFANELILHMCEDEISYFDRFVNVHQKQINGKVADTLLFFSTKVAGSDKFTIPLSRTELGALVCSTRESVIRSLRELSNSGIIKVSGKNFEICKKELLISISTNG